MRMSDATTEQLFQIAAEEDVAIGIKYAAVREMQRRNGRFKDWMIEEIFRMFPRNDVSDIAQKLNVSYRFLNLKLYQLGLKRNEANGL